MEVENVENAPAEEVCYQSDIIKLHILKIKPSMHVYKTMMIRAYLIVHQKYNVYLTCAYNRFVYYFMEYNFLIAY